MMQKKEIEKLFQGKIAVQDSQHVVIDLTDSRKTLELSVDNDVLALLVTHQGYVRNILKHLKRRSTKKIAKEAITINRRNYQIFI